MPTRILIVDDHRMMVEGLQSILDADPELEVVGTAEDGREAIRQTEALAPDVIIMDVGMRELNGAEATRRILADHPSARVVALSTHSDGRSVLSMLRAGASAYVLKANAYEDLLRAVRAVTAGRKHLSEEITDTVVKAGLLEADGDEQSAFRVLGPREREVLQLIAEGRSSPAIAKELGVSTSTVETHRRNIMRKLDLHSVADLTRYAIREGLSPLDEP